MGEHRNQIDATTILARSDFVNVHSGWLSQRLLGGQIIVRNFIIFSVKNGNGSRKPLAN